MILDSRIRIAFHKKLDETYELITILTGSEHHLRINVAKLEKSIEQR